VKLPGWVVDDVESVHQEVRHLRGTTPQERWQMAIACAEDALWALSLSDRAEQALTRRDPLPESTIAALQRLRREAGWGADGP
jgi:hypothetical protein